MVTSDDSGVVVVNFVIFSWPRNYCSRYNAHCGVCAPGMGILYCGGEGRGRGDLSCIIYLLFGRL